MENPYTNLAREALACHFNGKTLDNNRITNKTLLTKSACFVSLHQKSTHQLRGCIGTIFPSYPMLAQEIIHNAVAAATSDDRFPPISKGELGDLDISVDVLSYPEKVAEKDLDPRSFGVIVKAGDGRTGVLLPNLEGIDKTSDQIAIALQKAGISQDDRYEIFRFTTKRYI